MNEFLQNIFSNEFSTEFNQLLVHSVKHSKKLATATAPLLWQKCLEFQGKKPFTYNIKFLNMYALFFYSFSFDPSSW